MELEQRFYNYFKREVKTHGDECSKECGHLRWTEHKKPYLQCSIFRSRIDDLKRCFLCLDFFEEEKIKPCPFCGNHYLTISKIEKTTTLDHEIKKFIECPNCGIQTQFYFSEKNLIDDWNKRA